jgi:hypothetical protein
LSINLLRINSAKDLKVSVDSSVTEFTLSEILRSLRFLRMTRDEVSPQNDGKDEVFPQNDGKDEVSPQNDGKDEVSPQNDGKDEVFPQNDGKDEVSPQNDSSIYLWLFVFGDLNLFRIWSL